jgi:hypothetical protein
VNQVDSALIFFQALMRDTSFSNPYYNAVRYETLGTLLSKKGFLKEGLAHQLKGMQINRELGELNAQSYFNIAATYRKLGQYNEDEHFLNTALNLVAYEKDWALQKKIWRAKAENWALQRKPWQAFSAQDSAFSYYDKEVDSSVISRARELEAKYSLLEKDNQIKSLALESERATQRQRSMTRRIICIATLLVVFLYLVWRSKKNKMSVRENNLRQQLLRGQIDSHFLSNSVEGLQDLIETGNKESAIEFTEQLTRLYRLSLENTLEPFVPLQKELDAVVCYLALHQTLSAHQFEYHIEMSNIANQKAILIPPMLLQPFAENAILHGFTSQKEKGQLNIYIKKDHKALYCVIEDNGRGFQTADDNSQKRPLSTIITQERLEILGRQTKTRAQLNIIDRKETGDGTGVRVELIVPYQTERKTKDPVKK